MTTFRKENVMMNPKPIWWPYVKPDGDGIKPDGNGAACRPAGDGGTAIIVPIDTAI